VIRWSSFIADDTGDVDYVRVRALASVLLAVLGGLVTTAVTLIVLFTAKEVPVTIFSIMVTALVLPLTGGKIGDAFSGVLQRKVAAKIQVGDAPGRRTTDPAIPPLT
jgi:hypothetical protein